MTLSLAWIRKVNTVEELVIATDSRLRFGCAWDCSPKIFPLSRGDCAICFAGNTMYAYPIMEQIRNAITMYPKADSRALDLCDLKGHLLRVVRNMESLIHDLPKGKKEKDIPDALFILAGYSWAKAEFKIWILYYNAAHKQFEFKRPSMLHGNRIAIIGDDVGDAQRQILNLAREREIPKKNGFNMEPFEVLRDFCRDPKRHHIGGAPQVVKVYKHLNSMPYAVYWPNKESNGRSLMGRPLLEYEMANYLMLDPDSLKTEDYVPAPAKSRKSGLNLQDDAL
ncbi:hypothetical protein ACFQPC_07830 [Herminiimonas glaciei]|uniref:Uncharacterized protein n=1 Tax=Herminiimonas glaciei TaxID=523788 RepID=A0ABW2IA65_9BURK